MNFRPSDRLKKMFRDYDSTHRTRGNKICHYIGITSIVVTLLGLLSRITFSGAEVEMQLFRLDGAIIFIALALMINFYWDWKITIPYFFCVMGLYLIGRTLPGPVLWSFFVFGWIMQFVGHYVYEKKSPAFYENLLHLFIGPMWIFSHLVGYYPESRSNR